MKKMLFALFVLGTVFASCSKDTINFPPPSLSNTNTITAMVDSVPVVFNTEVQADTAYHSYSGHILVINAWEGEIANSDFISFSIVCPDKIGVGTYNPSSFFYWQQSDSTAYNFSSVDDVKLSITSVTDSTIGGVFSGKVFENYHDGTSSMHTITNGKFDAKIRSL
jgi:hypothetical protein